MIYAIIIFSNIGIGLGAYILGFSHGREMAERIYYADLRENKGQ